MFVPLFFRNLHLPQLFAPILCGVIQLQRRYNGEDRHRRDMLPSFLPVPIVATVVPVAYRTGSLVTVGSMITPFQPPTLSVFFTLFPLSVCGERGASAICGYQKDISETLEKVKSEKEKHS